MDISKINGTLAGQIAKKLDKADGKEDGKISASIWNDFVKDKGGKQIQSFISIENAMNSINSYAVRGASKSQEGQKVNDLAKKWLSELGDVDMSIDVSAKVGSKQQQKEVPPQKDTNPPQKDTNPPKKENPKVATGVWNPIYANKTVENYITGKAETYDENGYLIKEHDEKGNTTKLVFRNADGSVKQYDEYEYDEKGNTTKDVTRNADGSVKQYVEYEYDEKGNKTKSVHRNADGSVKEYYEYEYDEKGNKTKDVTRKADGSVLEYYEW